MFWMIDTPRSFLGALCGNGDEVLVGRGDLQAGNVGSVDVGGSGDVDPRRVGRVPGSGDVAGPVGGVDDEFAPSAVRQPSHAQAHTGAPGPSGEHRGSTDLR